MACAPSGGVVVSAYGAEQAPYCYGMEYTDANSILVSRHSSFLLNSWPSWATEATDDPSPLFSVCRQPHHFRQWMTTPVHNMILLGGLPPVNISCFDPLTLADWLFHAPEQTTATAASLSKDLGCGTVFLLNCVHQTLRWRRSVTDLRHSCSICNYYPAHLQLFPI